MCFPGDVAWLHMNKQEAINFHLLYGNKSLQSQTEIDARVTLLQPAYDP